MKLDLGAGPVSPDGFIPIGHRHGSEIYPLPFADESVDEVRSSHALEHFPKAIVPKVLAEWVRVLKKGGRIRIAVPDFAKIAENYTNGVAQPTEGYVLGGQIDADDFHKALFDKDRLRQLMAAQQLVLLRSWKSELENDCAALPISLNIEGYKPHFGELKISGAMSMPRVTWTDNSFCCMEAAIDCGVRIHKHGSAPYWDVDVTTVLEHVLETENPDIVCTIDYDSVFRSAHLAYLIQLMMVHPEADAIAPVQSSRHLKTTLFTVKESGGDNAPRISRARFESDLMPISTAHFGLTLIRADKLRTLPKPWFHGQPDKEGSWKEGGGCVHADINFWRKWEEHGRTLFLANRVPIGHQEVVIKWPDENLEAFYQPMSDWHKNGMPAGVWK